MSIFRSNVTKVNIAWCFLIVSGITSFYFAKKNVQAQRVEGLKLRQKIKEQVEREKREQKEQPERPEA